MYSKGREIRNECIMYLCMPGYKRKKVNNSLSLYKCTLIKWRLFRIFAYLQKMQ